MSKEIRTGVVAVITIILFIWGYNFLKGQSFLNTNKRYFRVEYSDVEGLSESSLVTINGLKVGKIDDIQFHKEKIGYLIVVFTVEEDIRFSKKSIVKIQPSSPFGSSNLAIIPEYKGELAASGDFLKGEKEVSLLTSIGERLDPIQSKLENAIVSADTLFNNLNNILDLKTQSSLKTSIKTLEYTLNEVNKTIAVINEAVNSTSTDLKESLKNTRHITENISKISDTIANSNLGDVIKKAELSLSSIDTLLKNINKGKGSMGKLVNDDALYNNLTSTSKELEELLRDIKLNPKRFVHFSLFGRRQKRYEPSENSENNEDKNLEEK